MVRTIQRGLRILSGIALLTGVVLLVQAEVAKENQITSLHQNINAVIASHQSTTVTIPLLGETIPSEQFIDFNLLKGGFHVDFEGPPTALAVFDDGTEGPLAKDFGIKGGKVRFKGPAGQLVAVKIGPYRNEAQSIPLPDRRGAVAPSENSQPFPRSVASRPEPEKPFPAPARVPAEARHPVQEPIAVQQNGVYSFSLIGCERVGNSIVCYFRVKNTGSQTVGVNLGSSYLVDNLGNSSSTHTHIVFNGAVGSIEPDIPVSFTLSADVLSADAESVSIILDSANSSLQGTTIFKNIPLRK